ncbi:Hypothetical protein PBC10988_24300 [Planctomycetales bacterium 10988]|nr:Hypothetical protein PBC10988_24300 [Planctomycetales bacterium 10988]
MKFLKLEIENFGHFTQAGPKQHQFEFSPGLQLIYGPNEAGKSTLLHLMRGMLFGFPRLSPFVFAIEQGEMAATATVLFDRPQPREAEYRRRKGNKKIVTGSFTDNNEPIDEAALDQLLGHANETLYRHVFGFSLEELSQGQQLLEQGSLRDALYGSGMGGLSNFQRVLQQLTQDHEELFLPNVRAKKVINEQIRLLTDRERQLQAAMLKPTEYHQLEQSVKEAEQSATRAKEELQAILQESSRVDRLIQGMEPFRTLQTLQEQLEELHEAAAIPREFVEPFEKDWQDESQLRQGLEVVRANCKHINETLDRIEVLPKLLADQNRIERLYQKTSEIAGFRRDLPTREREAAAIVEEARHEINRLHEEWTVAFVEDFQLNVSQKHFLQELVESEERLRHQQQTHHEQRERLESELSDYHQQLDDLPTVESSRLEALLRQSSTYEQQRRNLREANQQLAEQQIEIETLLKRLDPPCAESTLDLLDLPVPPVAALAEWKSRLYAIQQRRQRAEDEVKRREKEASEQQQTLEQLQIDHQIPSQEKLKSTRKRRDAGWDLIQRRYIDGEDIREEIQAWLPEADARLIEQFETEIQNADQLADELFAHSKHVAELKQVERQLSRLQSSLDQARQRLTEATEEEAAWQTEWRAFWEPCELVPLDWASMQVWTETFHALDSAAKSFRKQKEQKEQLLGEIEDFEVQLAEAFPDEAATADERLLKVEQTVEQARDARSRRGFLERQSQRNFESLRKLEAQEKQHATDFSKWEQDWKAFLEQLQFPRDWPPKTVKQVVVELESIRLQLRESQSLGIRISDMQQGLKDFAKEVQELAAEVAPDLISQLPENAVAVLYERLQRTQRAYQKQTDLLEQREALQAEEQTLSATLSSCRQRVEERLAQTGADSPETFLRWAAQAREVDRLKERLREIQERLDILRGKEAREDFYEALAQADPSALKVSHEELSASQHQAEAKYQAASELLGEKRADIKRRAEGQTPVTQLSAELENERAKLAGLIDRWAPKVLACHLMQQALDRFERDHQPEMLQEAGDFLRAMTEGRYLGIRRKLDEQGTPLVVDAQGNTKEPAQLSTGTREQLYLAIRLAYMQHYCRNREPLPVVMDDVLVNFDERRAAATLKVLFDLSQDLQILFLTCHRRTLELGQSLCEDLNPILLEKQFSEVTV